jgi:SAM-dependent methyltransferase
VTTPAFASLRGGMDTLFMSGRDDVRRSYDRLARAYADHLLDELARKPLDRALLDAFAETVRGRGPVLEVGCGPGQVSRYLHDRGVTISGLDLSSEMIHVARASHPGVEFAEGDLFHLELTDGRLAGIVAFYAIVNLEPERIGRAFAELARTLAPGGLLLLSFHIGVEPIHVDELWGVPIALDFWLFETAWVERELVGAGLRVEMKLEREPIPDVEVATRRAYLLARKPLG